MNCSFCGKSCKNPNSLRNHERLCKQNPNRQLTTYEKYGPTKGFNNFGRVGWNKGKTKETDPRIAKYAKTLKEKYDAGIYVIDNPMNYPENRKKLSETMKRIYGVNPPKVAGRSKCGWYKGFYCRSSWELAYVIYNIEHNINIKANTKGFKYIWKDEEHTYFPDFYLPDEDTYIEIKGYYDEKAKEKTKQFKGNLMVLEKKEMEIYLLYCQEHYGNDFIKLYEK